MLRVFRGASPLGFADTPNYVEWQIEPFVTYLRGWILEVGIGYGSLAVLLRQYGRLRGNRQRSR